MYWDDLKALIERNKNPWSTLHYFARLNYVPQNKMTICDFDYPRRKPEEFFTVGFFEADWYVCSQVCVSSFFNGEIPLRSFAGRAEGDTVAEEPQRGAIDTIKALLTTGTVRPTEEIREWLRMNGSRP